MEYHQKLQKEKQLFLGACCNPDSYEHFSSVARFLRQTNAAMKDELLEYLQKKAQDAVNRPGRFTTIGDIEPSEPLRTNPVELKSHPPPEPAEARIFGLTAHTPKARPEALELNKSLGSADKIAGSRSVFDEPSPFRVITSTKRLAVHELDNQISHIKHHVKHIQQKLRILNCIKSNSKHLSELSGESRSRLENRINEDYENF